MVVGVKLRMPFAELEGEARGILGWNWYAVIKSKTVAGFSS